MSKTWEELKERLAEARALEEAMILFEWDNETLAPPAAMDQTARTVERLSGTYFKLMTDKRLGELLDACESQSLDEDQQAILRAAKKKREELVKLPKEEYETYTGLTARASSVWAKAREAEDFSQFAPVLEEILSYKKKFAACKAKEGQELYDVMLDDFEEGFPWKSWTGSSIF